jgi:hypothetical protein
MAREQGTYLPLAPARRWVGDLLHASRHVPLVPFERRMDLSALAAVRSQLEEPPSWCALFTKAYGIVTMRRPELRRAYFSFPRPRLYEHPHSIAAIAVERVWQEDRAVFFARLLQPGKQPLVRIQRYLDHFKQAPVEKIDSFRRLIRLSRYPRPVRRLLWWLTLHAGGSIRARRTGTFGVSVTAGLGASALALISPLTTTLHYGPLDGKGSLDVRVTFDHRVLDGSTVARALSDLEEVLNTEMIGELRREQRTRRDGMSYLPPAAVRRH